MRIARRLASAAALIHNARVQVVTQAATAAMIASDRHVTTLAVTVFAPGQGAIQVAPQVLSVLAQVVPIAAAHQ